MRAFRPSQMVRSEDEDEDLGIKQVKLRNIQVYAQLVRAKKPLFEPIQFVREGRIEP